MRLQQWIVAACTAVSAVAATSSAQAIPYGTACAGASGIVPTIGTTGFPVIGSTFDINITGVPSAPGFALVGPMSLEPGLALDPFGLPGCELALLNTSTTPIATNGLGEFNIVGLSTFMPAGVRLNLQVWLADLGPGSLGALTQGLGVTSMLPSGNAGGEVIVTEFMKNPSFVPDVNGEWFELYNTTLNPIDIEYWTMTNLLGTQTHLINNGGAGVVIPAGGYITLGNNGDPLVNGNQTHEYVYGADFTLGNGDDEIIILDHTGIEIDRVVYDNGVTFPDPGGESVELNPLLLDGLSNDFGANWSAATCFIGGIPCSIDRGTPGAVNGACTTSPCPNVGTGTLIFSEVMQNPLAVDGSVGEWLEVHNTTGASIDMAGYIISWGGAEVISSSVVVPAGGYAVFARNGNSVLNGGLPSVDYVWASHMTLGNSEELIQIYDTTATLVFALQYDNGATFPDPEGRAMSLDPSKLNAADAVLGGNWCTASTSYGAGDLGTPGSANPVCAVGELGDVIIVEFLQDPSAVADSLGEWLELYNTTGGTIDLDGWMLRDDGTNFHAITGPLLIGSGQRLVLGNNGSVLTNGGVTVDYVYSGFTLGNGADEIILEDDFGLEQDRVVYDGGPVFPDQSGTSTSYDESAGLNAISNNVGANWCTSTTAMSGGDLGTPGLLNDACP